MYLISPNQKQYKANLHCHSTCSDGSLTPQQLKEAYKAEGYSVLAITDHEIPKAHCELSDADFLTITGYETCIRPSPDAVFDRYGQEVHLNFLARDPQNESIVCYAPKYCKYMPEEEKAKLKKVGPDLPRELTKECVNTLIRAARENGYLVTFNHPVWSMQDEADIMEYDGFFSIEMCNYDSYLISRLEYNGALYDKLLCRGKRVFCHSTDDNHNNKPFGDPLCDSFGGFTMLMPEEFTYDGIIKALETGRMYSSMGPLFKEISMEGNRIHIECSPVTEIRVFVGSKRTKRKFAQPGQTITAADFELDDMAKYVRVSVTDSCGRAADTRGYFRDELEF